jgi:hypothetical protein
MNNCNIGKITVNCNETLQHINPMNRDPEKLRQWQQRSRQKQRDNPKPRSPLRKVSKKQAAANREYSARRAMHLEANPNCVRCESLGVVTPATQIHHARGRDGDALLDDSDFLAVCAYCHEWMHGHPGEAHALGWMKSRHRRND